MPGRLATIASNAYLPIRDHGAIGDGRSLALVSRDGGIDWWSPGRFDAPSVFAAILDARRGGSWRLAPAGARESVQRYVPDTNVLETEHTTPSGRVLVRDHLAFGEDTGTTDSVLVRRAIGLEGQVEMETVFAPRFQYGRVQPRFSLTPAGLLASGAGEIAIVRGALAWHRPARGVRRASFTLRAGETLATWMRHASVTPPVPFAAPLACPDAAELERRAIERWREWAARTECEGPDATLVRRSALALKLLQFRANGAFVAAGTTSLPEALGGVRNWDYRYTWVRDGALTAKALHDVGHREDSARFADWLRRTLAERPAEMRIMYTVSGSGDLPEREIAGLEGYRASAPVRVGNAAVHQRQLDVYGELVEFLASERGAESWPLIRSVARFVAEHWRAPDQGIWEMRCEPRHFVLSKAMAWAALDRAERFARDIGEAPDPTWRAEADSIRAQVFERGYDPHKGAFVQAYGYPWLDASNLMLPLIGFVDADDPRMVATVDRTLQELTVDGLVYRYLGDDGLPGGEAAFAYCSFWLVEVLAMQGRVRQAREVFGRITARATALGLFAEEIDVATGEHLGNFPQAFPHAGLIQAARALHKAER